MKLKFLLAVILLSTVEICIAQKRETSEKANNKTITAIYNKKGLQVSNADSTFSSNIGIRFQFRFFTPFDADPRSVSGYAQEVRPTIFIRRARFKMKGHAGWDYLKYNLEYDFPTSRLLNAFLKIEKWKGFNTMIGQYKAPYNRERIISSGDQTFTERSIVNRAFTIDRQIGITFYGNFGAERIANFDYWASVYTGVGILGKINDDNHLMYVGRLQWNFLGEPIPIGESDSNIKGHERPRAGIAVAGASNISPYTRFSSGGGSQLDQFSTGEPGQYQVDQMTQDFIFKYQGLSLMQEFHYKIVNDRIENVTTNMRGLFAQVGWFPGYVLQGMTKKLQFAFRYGYNDENTSSNEETYHDEFTIGANYYFNSFRNRLQADFSVLNMRMPGETINAERVRLQWEITF